MCLQRLFRVVRPLSVHEGPGSRDGFRGWRHGIAGLAGSGLHVFQHAGDAAQLRCRPEQGTLGGFLFTVGGLRQETLELFQGSCVHVGYSLSDNGTVSRSGSLRKSYVAEKSFLLPAKAGPGCCIHCH
nr:MAG TPA: hypothetical protein [Caudoviricetes sp.]